MVALKPGLSFKQPTHFAFTEANEKEARKIISRYPAGKQRSAVIPLLDIAQRQHKGWLPRAAIEYVAEFLDLAAIRVYEIASFYTMFNLGPVGECLIQICRTTPCWLRGSDQITHMCKEKLGIDIGETTVDGKFTLVEVECLGACVNAPVIQVNDDFYEDLSPENFERVLDDFADGKVPAPGSQQGRQGSAPLAVVTGKHNNVQKKRNREQ